MSIEYLPVGIACNLKCEYCYQDPMRDAGNITSPIQWDKAKAVLEKHNHNFTVFGGEPLLAPFSHLEEVFKWGFEKFGKNGIQTNGALITDKHIELFKKYNVSVGLSLDGPEGNNRLRCDIGETYRIHMNLEELCRAGIYPSIICTVSKANANQATIAWFQYLDELGVRFLNLHILEVDKGRKEHALSTEQNIEFFRRAYEFAKTSKMFVNPFMDMYSLLTQDEPSVSCIWNACDPLTTPAVQGVGPDGTESNCGRTNKDGVNWIKTEGESKERYIALFHTPQQYGGCADCRFFFACKGQCPGTAIDGDWRNRTADCLFWYSLFEIIELDIVAEKRLPITREPQKLKAIVDGFLNHKVENSHTDIAHLDTPHTDWHLDSDAPEKTTGVVASWI